MRIWIVGAGGIGCVLGARLVGVPDLEVLFIDTWAENVAKMRSDGLTVEYPGETKRVRVSAFHVSDVATVVPPDAVLLCVKAFQTDDAVEAIRPCLAENAYVVSLQNAINEERIAEIIGHRRTVGAIVLFDGALVGPAHASQIRSKPLVMGELDGTVSERLERLATFLRASVPVVLSTNIWGELWSKLVRNLVLTTVSAVTGMGFGQLAVDPVARRLGLRLGAEAVRVALALKVPLVDRELFASPPEAFLAPVGSAEFAKLEENCRVEYEPLPRLRGSMLQDLEKGRPTEIDQMSGYIVRKGADLGIATPANATMLALIKDLERGAISPSPSLLDRFAVRPM